MSDAMPVVVLTLAPRVFVAGRVFVVRADSMLCLPYPDYPGFAIMIRYCPALILKHRGKGASGPAAVDPDVLFDQPTTNAEKLRHV